MLTLPYLHIDLLLRARRGILQGYTVVPASGMTWMPQPSGTLTECGEGLIGVERSSSPEGVTMMMYSSNCDFAARADGAVSCSGVDQGERING